MYLIIKTKIIITRSINVDLLSLLVKPNQFPANFIKDDIILKKAERRQDAIYAFFIRKSMVWKNKLVGINKKS